VNYAGVLEIVERGDAVLRGFPYREWPDLHALFFTAGVFLELRLEPGPEEKIEAMTWYEPDMLRRVAEPILPEKVPDDCLRALSELPKEVQDAAMELWGLASRLRERLADGTRWVKGTRTEPFLMKGSDGWLSLEVQRGDLTGLRRWDETDLRSELCQVLLRDRAAKASPVERRLRAKALELDARAQSELDALDDPAMGFAVKEGHGFERICVRRSDGFARMHLLDGKPYELDWSSAEGVRHEILRALVERGEGRLIRLHKELFDDIASKTDRSRYCASCAKANSRSGRFHCRPTRSGPSTSAGGSFAFAIRWTAAARQSPNARPYASFASAATASWYFTSERMADHAGGLARTEYTHQVQEYVATLADLIDNPDRKVREREAVLLLSALVGAVSMARAVDDADLSKQILTSAAAVLKERIPG
jgi:hypothetical protein